ncbi:unnamed protein product [Rotaria sp. Silwood1]|nr:unnamed protein product [Rotaria sp. Silwood1]
MDELLEYNDRNMTDSLNIYSLKNDCDALEEWNIQKVYEDLVTVLKLTSNDPCTSYDDPFNNGGVIHYEKRPPVQTFSSDKSYDPKTLLDENNDDTEFFNPKEWTMEDPSSSKVRPPRLFDFLCLLLNNLRYASYASWIKKDEGLFKIHNPAKVASLWKKVKLRQTHGLMSYDTFSRAIRYYYKSGLMIKTHRKHTYRFAHK